MSSSAIRSMACASASAFAIIGAEFLRASKLNSEVPRPLEHSKKWFVQGMRKCRAKRATDHEKALRDLGRSGNGMPRRVDRIVFPELEHNENN